MIDTTWCKVASVVGRPSWFGRPPSVEELLLMYRSRIERTHVGGN
jgi:hypothetical protein